MVFLNRILDLGQLFVESEARRARLPSGSFDQDTESLTPRFGGQKSSEYVLVVENLNIDRVERADWMDKAISKLLAFFLGRKSTEHSIKNNENTSVVFVDTVRIASMMYTMMAWSIDDVFQKTTALKQLSMDPELVDQVHVTVNEINRWPDKKCQWSVKEKARVLLEY